MQELQSTNEELETALEELYPTNPGASQFLGTEKRAIRPNLLSSVEKQ